MSRTFFILGFLLVAIVPLFEAYNILFMLPFGSKSHKNVFDPVAEELARRGHKVTLFTQLEDKNEVPGVKNYVSKELVGIFDKHHVSFFHGSVNGAEFFRIMSTLVLDMTNVTYSDPFIGDLLKEPRDPTTGKPKFDLLVMDACFNDFVLPIAYHMGIPTVIFSPSGTFIHQAWNLDVPYPYSVYPSPTMDLPDHMSFTQRAVNSFTNMFFVMLLNHCIFPWEDEIIRKFIPNSPSVLELEKKVNFMISNSHPPIGLRKPLMPYAVEIGGLNCFPAKPLPKDLEDFLQSAGKDGVIYFSLGSVTKGDSMPLEMRTKVLEVFAKLPQKILWKYEQDIPSLPKNIKLIKWAPQQDLLGHPQLRLFITHGGGLSTCEASYHGCPILGFPLSADQEGNMAIAKRQGVADFLDWKTFTPEQLLEAINRMLNDKSYKEKSMQSSILLKDRVLKPVEEAAYWIEYVVRHDGAHFLRSSAGELNFFQYFLIDVLAVAFLTILVVIVILLCVLRCLLKFICRKLGINCCGWCCCNSEKKQKDANKSKRQKKNN